MSKMSFLIKIINMIESLFSNNVQVQKKDIYESNDKIQKKLEKHEQHLKLILHSRKGNNK